MRARGAVGRVCAHSFRSLPRPQRNPRARSESDQTQTRSVHNHSRPARPGIRSFYARRSDEFQTSQRQEHRSACNLSAATRLCATRLPCAHSFHIRSAIMPRSDDGKRIKNVGYHVISMQFEQQTSALLVGCSSTLLRHTTRHITRATPSRSIAARHLCGTCSAPQHRNRGTCTFSAPRRSGSCVQCE